MAIFNTGFSNWQMLKNVQIKFTLLHIVVGYGSLLKPNKGRDKHRNIKVPFRFLLSCKIVAREIVVTSSDDEKQTLC